VTIWRVVFRDGIVPSLPTEGLLALRDALACDDVRLVQGSTTVPPPLMSVQDWPLEAADAVAFCFWQGRELSTVGEAEEAWARVMFECDHRLGEPAACRHFLNAWDETPRQEMFRELLAEVELAIRERGVEEPLIVPTKQDVR
jgi:hypothetical protein